MSAIRGDKPDLVVGVDFGMTYTGVAWTNLTNATQSIDNWPGLLDAHEVKVPTKITYGPEGVRKWGFLCEDEDGEEIDEVFECFKIYLDQNSIDVARQNGLNDGTVPATVEAAKMLVTDYLQQIYRQIKRSIEANIGRWDNKKVEFIFSTPTTWQTQSIMTDFLEAIHGAGFGRDSPLHSARLELTEAEAAGIYVAANPQVHFAPGNIVLVVDAGGGTTDLGLLEVVDSNPNDLHLKQCASVTGVGIGSTMIDRAFQMLVQRRLDENPDAQAFLPRHLALKLSRSSAFRAVKHKFGTELVDQPEYRFALDRLGLNISQDFSHPGMRIERGRMQFSRAEIQALFDRQIKGIMGKINEQLEWIRVNRRGEKVDFLVLSGGLGGSAYVKTILDHHYGSMQMSIIRSQEPRLSVVKGLVMDRKQKLTSGTAALKTRIARASYGVLCREIYDPSIHIGAEIVNDLYKKDQRWAKDQIQWLIKKGDEINDTDKPPERTFQMKMAPGATSRVWDTPIIISHSDRSSLPRMLKQAGAHKLCDVQSNFQGVAVSEFKLKNKRCWQGKRYYRVEFSVRVIAAPADLKFEVWFNGKQYNRTHDAVTVEWDKEGAAVRPPKREVDPQVFVEAYDRRY